MPVAVLPRLKTFGPVWLPSPPAAAIRGYVAAADAAPHALGMAEKRCEGPSPLRYVSGKPLGTYVAYILCFTEKGENGCNEWSTGAYNAS